MTRSDLQRSIVARTHRGKGRTRPFGPRRPYVSACRELAASPRGQQLVADGHFAHRCAALGRHPAARPLVGAAALGLMRAVSVQRSQGERLLEQRPLARRKRRRAHGPLRPPPPPTPPPALRRRRIALHLRPGSVGDQGLRLGECSTNRAVAATPTRQRGRAAQPPGRTRTRRTPGPSPRSGRRRRPHRGGTVSPPAPGRRGRAASASSQNHRTAPTSAGAAEQGRQHGGTHPRRRSSAAGRGGCIPGHGPSAGDRGRANLGSIRASRLTAHRHRRRANPGGHNGR